MQPTVTDAVAEYDTATWSLLSLYRGSSRIGPNFPAATANDVSGFAPPFQAFLKGVVQAVDNRHISTAVGLGLVRCAFLKRCPFFTSLV